MRRPRRRWIDLAAFAAFFLGACVGVPPAGLPPVAGKADACGYTWYLFAPPASVITIRQEPDWRKYRGRCQEFTIRGCTTTTVIGDARIADIEIREPLAQAVANPSECNVAFHELRHALGFAHIEAHGYVPRDFTR